MKRATAPGYDLFKLIVTIILIVILLLMLLRGCASLPAAPAPVEGDVGPGPTDAPQPLLETEVASEVVESATPSLPAATDTPITEPPTVTAVPTESESAPTATAAPAESESAPTATAASTESESTPTATPDTAGDAVSSDDTCNTSVPSRLSVGEMAQVVQRLNMRSDASITAPILRTNPINTQVEIIGGPVCTPVGDNAYLWWQIRLQDGSEGWSAEAPLIDAIYLLEPV